MGQKVVQYVVGTTLDAKPITATHILVDDALPKEKSKPSAQHLKGSVPEPLTTRKTCSHAQKEARIKHQTQQTKKKK